MPSPTEHNERPHASASRAAADRASHLAELGSMAPLYAHEVNNLLTQLSARAQLALMRPGDPQLGQQALQSVEDCCRRIEQLTQIFMTPDGTEVEGEGAGRVSVREIHRRVCTSVREHDRQRLGLVLDDQSDGYAPDLRPVMLEQVLSNLIINALRAIQEHPHPQDPHHRIIFESRAFEPDACSTWNIPGTRGIELSIEDSGAGMNPKQVTQLNSGQAIDRPPGRSASGIARHGLGLRVCRKLLSAAGGSIRCDSSINQGTRITLRLPAIKIDQEQLRSAA